MDSTLNATPSEAPAPPEGSIDEVIARIEGEVLDQVRGLVRWGAAPFLFLVAAAVILSGKASWTFVGWMASASLVLAATVTPRFSLATRKLGLCLGITALGVSALIQFGPNIGTGLLFSMAALGGAFFFGVRGAVAALSVLLLGLIATGLATTKGLITPESAPPSSWAWTRMIISSTISLSGCTMLFLWVQRAFRSSVAAQIAAKTEQRLAAGQRERMLQHAHSRQRLESLGRLAGGVAHDFNNALVVIQSGVELLRQGCDQEEAHQLLDEIGQGVARAAATARQLLTFSKPNRAGVTGLAEPQAMISTLAITLERFLPDNVRVQTEVEHTAPIAIDSATLEQVLLNLALNARDAMKTGGTLTLGCRSSAAQHEVIIEVADQGTGMSPELRARIFEPFFSTKGEHGTGLGLAMVLSVVQQHHGRIEVQSELGRGTRFSLHLPVSAASVEVPRQVQRVAPTKGLRVLVVEDQLAVREALVRTISRLGAQVVAVDGVVAARAAMAGEAFSVLVTDGLLADGSAADIISSFRAERAGAPVIVCSGNLPDTLELNGQALEHHFLPKPFAPSELLRLIADLGDPQPGRGAGVTPAGREERSHEARRVSEAAPDLDQP